MTRTTWIILAVIIILLIAIAVEGRSQRRKTVPDAVRALRALQRSNEPVEVTRRTNIACRCGERFVPQTPTGTRAVARHESDGTHTILFVSPDTHVCGVDCPPGSANHIDVRHRDDVEPVTPVVPESVDDIPAPAPHEGATADWSPAAELAAIGEGALLAAGTPTVSIDDFTDEEIRLARPGTPTVSVDDFTDEELWEASFDADLRRLDDALEAARMLCKTRMVAAVSSDPDALLSAMREIDLRDVESHARAAAAATVLITMEIGPLARRSPHRVTPAIARRARKRENQALGR